MALTAIQVTSGWHMLRPSSSENRRNPAQNLEQLRHTQPESAQKLPGCKDPTPGPSTASPTRWEQQCQLPTCAVP